MELNEPIAFLTGLPGWLEICVVLFVGLLFFGRRLPSIAHSIGQSLVEFKRGLRSAEKFDEPDDRAKLPEKDRE